MINVDDPVIKQITGRGLKIAAHQYLNPTTRRLTAVIQATDPKTKKSIAGRSNSGQPDEALEQLAKAAGIESDAGVG